MTTRRDKDSRVVYSTEQGRMCPSCERPVAECACRKKKVVPEGDGIVRVGRETKGRKGKAVTLITGVPMDWEGLRKLTKQLKERCGSGGTVKDGVIEIQGDHRDILVKALEKQGYVVRRSGG
jgi:translation initiation factor 1